MDGVQLQIGITLDEKAVATLVELLRQGVSQGAIQDEKREARIRASQHALFGGQEPPEDMGLLIDTRQAARLLKVSEKTVWNMYTTGRMPKPIRIGQCVRWGYEELRAWVVAGCLTQEEWKWSADKTAL
jgi:predicted DNA-binding transcriptional regulator AlpA